LSIFDLTNISLMKHYLKVLEKTVASCWDKLSHCNFQGEQFTYGQLATEIARLHIIFEKIGVKEGEKIALCARNSSRWGIGFLAINTYHAVAVPILNEFLPESVANLTDHSDSVILFTDSDIWEKLDLSAMPKLKCAINCADYKPLYTGDAAIADAFTTLDELFNSKYPSGFGKDNVSYGETDFEHIAVINYTSGTTSAPKGVMISSGNLSATLEFCIDNMPCTPEDNMVSMLPLAHMYGLVIEYLFPCCAGCGVYFLGKTPSPTFLMKAMQEVKPFLVVTVPLVMEKVYKSAVKPAISKWYMKILLHIPVVSAFIYRKIGVKLQEAFGGKVGTFILGGAALNPIIEKEFKRMRFPFTVGYGMTEASPLISWERWNKFVPGSCGVACHKVRIDSEDPAHIAGEIQTTGPNICKGYFKNEEANSLLFTEDGWMHTGDLGIIDRYGNIFIKGRSKSMILTANGQNIYPEEVEAVINAQPYVSESLAVDRNGKIVALIVLDKDAIKAAKLDSEAVSDIPENIRLASNRQLPQFSQVTKVEVMAAPFEKTPKLSIKRFLYK